jgi:ABC-type transport system involved in multi-copper enzyme maturation permease subunit
MTRTWVLARIVLLEMLRKKDIYVLAMIMVAVMGLLMSVNVFGLGGISTYVKDVGLLLCWAITAVLAIITSTRLIPQEEKNRTIYSLLSRPISRLEVVCGKCLGAWLSMVFAMVVMYGLVSLMTFFRGGTMALPLLLQAMILHAIALGLICSLGTALSIRLNADASATLTTVIVLTAFLIVPQIPSMLVEAKGTAKPILTLLYWILPHFEVLDLRWRLVHSNGELLSWSAFIQSALYGILCVAAFLALAWALFRKKLFNRDDSA